MEEYWKGLAWSGQTLLFVLALPIFPVRLQTSIVGTGELNFRVRNGNGWTLTVKNTNLCDRIAPKTTYSVIPDRVYAHTHPIEWYTIRDSNPGHPD